MNPTQPIKDFRAKLEEYFLGMNNIDRLMKDYVDPYILLEEQPCPIQIGKKVIFVGNLTLENNARYWDTYGRILVNLNSAIMAAELSEERRKEFLQKANLLWCGEAKDVMEFLIKWRWLYKDLCKMIFKTICKQQAYYLEGMTKTRKELKWHNCSYRYFVKNMTMEKLIQMIYLIYTYNFSAVKKNLRLILTAMSREGNYALRTFMPYYYQNLPGLTGTFFRPRLPKFSLFSKPSETIQVLNDN